MYIYTCTLCTLSVLCTCTVKCNKFHGTCRLNFMYIYFMTFLEPKSFSMLFSHGKLQISVWLLTHHEIFQIINFYDKHDF